MRDLAIKSFVTFFVIIDPVGILPLFIVLTARQDPQTRRKTTVRAFVLAGGVLIFFAFFGDFLLYFLGITMPAFEMAGGLLLLLLSTDMILVRHSGLRSVTEAETHEAIDRADVAVFPLAVPLIAGPGAITSVILLMGQARGDIGLQFIVIGVMLAVLGIGFVAFLFASRFMAWLGVTGINVMGRILGILLSALAVQYIIDGARNVIRSLGFS